MGMRKIWKNNRGATIVFAMAVFLIASIMSMVIVNAALNNVQRLAYQKQDEQAMLAVTSAAEYIGDNAEKVFVALLTSDPLTSDMRRMISVGSQADLQTELVLKSGSTKTNVNAIIRKRKDNAENGEVLYSVRMNYYVDAVTGKWKSRAAKGEVAEAATQVGEK